MRGRKHGNPVDPKSSVAAVEPDLSTAHLALQRGDVPTAERVCREALAKNGSSTGALSLLAAILCRSHRSAEAFAILRAELQARPQQPALQDVLATMLREFGFLDESFKIRAQLVKSMPDEFRHVNELGLCLMAMNRFPEATQSFRTAIRLSPNTAVLHENLGLCLHRQGNFRPAIEALQRAVDLVPMARTYSSMAKLYNEMNEDVLAQECQAKAYALDPNSVGGNVEMANMLGQQGKYDEADRHYARALELDPQNPGILLHRAHLLQQAGRFDEAETVCRSASELRPLWVEPYAMIASGRRFTESDRELLSRLVAISSHEKVSPDERAKAYMSLGKAFDDLGQYEVAMGNFDLANAWYERRLREARGPLNREKISDWNSQVIQTFTAEYFDRHRKLGSESELPVFVVGMIRSGTTLTEQILSSHPLVAGAGELTYWMQHSGDFHASPLQFLTSDQTDRFESEYLAQICRFQGDAARVIDKMPLNYMGLGLIHTVFPRAKIIHCRRHPVDNCLSIYMTPYGVSPVFAHNRSDIVFAYREYLRLMDHWRSVLPSDLFLEIDYERTVSDRENTLRSVTEFLGVDWSDSVLEHQQNQRTVKTPSFWQARQPIYTSSMARWRNYEPWLREFGELLNPADTSDSEGP